MKRVFKKGLNNGLKSANCDGANKDTVLQPLFCGVCMPPPLYLLALGNVRTSRQMLDAREELKPMAEQDVVALGSAAVNEGIFVFW